MEPNKQKHYQSMIDSTPDDLLCTVIDQLNSEHKKEEDQFLKNWQKMCLMEAVSSFSMSWFNLCRLKLKSTLESLEKISKETWHVNKISKTTSIITDEQLNDDIRHINSMKKHS